ncbi:MAG: glycosyltransferase family 2 protein, partial [Candidatus Omnitrophica bacterium]|nr:glycosyltransferase family 2 protein [Candidatus Omnitrophota bacterium]
EPSNEDENYYTRLIGYMTRIYYDLAFINAVLTGSITPLVGHNAYLRKDLLRQNEWWPENRVSEDLSVEIDLHTQGYYGKYADLIDMRFKEAVSSSILEEAKQYTKYIFGACEILFNRPADWLKKGIFTKQVRDFFGSKQLSIWKRIDLVIINKSRLFSLALLLPCLMISPFLPVYFFGVLGPLICFIGSGSVVTVLFYLRRASLNSAENKPSALHLLMRHLKYTLVFGWAIMSYSIFGLKGLWNYFMGKKLVIGSSNSGKQLDKTISIFQAVRDMQTVFKEQAAIIAVFVTMLVLSGRITQPYLGAGDMAWSYWLLLTEVSLLGILNPSLVYGVKNSTTNAYDRIKQYIRYIFQQLGNALSSGLAAVRAKPLLSPIREDDNYKTLQHPIVSQAMYAAAQKYILEPVVSAQFRKLAEALRILERYLIKSGKITGPPVVAYRTANGEIIWNLDQKEIITILSQHGYNRHVIDFITLQIILHENQANEEAAIEAQAEAFRQYQVQSESGQGLSNQENPAKKVTKAVKANPLKTILPLVVSLGILALGVALPGLGVSMLAASAVVLLGLGGLIVNIKSILDTGLARFFSGVNVFKTNRSRILALGDEYRQQGKKEFFKIGIGKTLSLMKSNRKFSLLLMAVGVGVSFLILPPVWFGFTFAFGIVLGALLPYVFSVTIQFFTSYSLEYADRANFVRGNIDDASLQNRERYYQELYNNSSRYSCSNSTHCPNSNSCIR